MNDQPARPAMTMREIRDALGHDRPAAPAVAPTAPPAACPECGDAGACNGGPCPLLDRHERYVAAILDALARDTSRGPNWGAAATAVMAVADVEQAALRAEVERLRADRATTLRDAADTVEAMNEGCSRPKPCYSCAARTDAADDLRDKASRLADEAQQPETEAWPTETAWIGEVLEDDGAWMFLGASPDRSVAERRCGHVTRRHPEAQTRIVRKTTTYTVAAQTDPPTHLPKGTNAENCPACKGTNPPYPFLCPGPDAPAPTEEPTR